MSVAGGARTDESVGRATGARLRCAWCDRLGCGWIADGRPQCAACRFPDRVTVAVTVAPSPLAPRSRADARAVVARWVRDARYVGPARRRGRGRSPWLFLYCGQVGTLAHWAAILDVTRQALWKAHRRASSRADAARAGAPHA